MPLDPSPQTPALRSRTATAARLLIVVNARASGIEDPRRTAAELVALTQELGREADGAVTETEAGLGEALRAAAAAGRRLVLVGGDGSVHAAVNAPLSRLPALALVPAGRANNIARALGIPTDRGRALEVACLAPTRSLDVLRVETPERRVYAVEAVSAGFHATARAGYAGENSADLSQGIRALAGAVRGYRPYRAQARVDGAELSSAVAAQLFVTNLPYYGYGFRVDPAADPADGRLAGVLIEATGRRSLLRLLGATRRGRHLGRPGVHRIAGRRAEVLAPMP